MPENVQKALQELAEFCLEQEDCSNCPMKEFCGKLPSEFVDLA